MKELQLIQLAKNGEADAYCALVERYQAGVIIHCDQFVRDRSVAEDIAQDAFVKGYHTLNKYDETKGAFSTWVYAIATNLAKDHIRRRRQQVSLDIIANIPSEPPILSSAERQEIRTVVKALQPPEYAKVIEAYYWHGKRYEEIANEMKVPASTIGTWLDRAKTQLRKELS